MVATIFTFLFALACIATFALGVRKEWRSARLAALIVAVSSFLLALLTAPTR